MFKFLWDLTIDGPCGKMYLMNLALICMFY